MKQRLKHAMDVSFRLSSEWMMVVLLVAVPMFVHFYTDSVLSAFQSVFILVILPNVCAVTLASFIVCTHAYRESKKDDD